METEELITFRSFCEEREKYIWYVGLKNTFDRHTLHIEGFPYMKVPKIIKEFTSEKQAKNFIYESRINH